jgi:hypothetical protein
MARVRSLRRYGNLVRLQRHLYPTDAGAACSWPDIDMPVGDCAPVSYTVVQWIDAWAGVSAPLQPYLSANLILVQTQRFERGHARRGIPLNSSRRRGLRGSPWCVYREQTSLHVGR